jgi:hypothetical protein
MRRRRDGERYGGFVIETQVVTEESQRLVDAFRQELIVKADLIAASEGKIELTAHREGGRFERVLVSTSSSSARRGSRRTTVDIRRLAEDVRAKVQTNAWKIDSATSKVVVAIHPHHKTFEIQVMVSF